jgi:hypothetical protein
MSVLIGVHLAGRAVQFGQQSQGNGHGPRIWINKTLLPPPPAPPAPPPHPSGAIPGVSLSSLRQDLGEITGAPLTPNGSVHTGHNLLTVTIDGHQLTVDLVPLGQTDTYVQSVSCEYQTAGAASVDSGMVSVIRRCMFASLYETALSPTEHAYLADYARTGGGVSLRTGAAATVRVINNATSYGVTVSSG